MYFAASYQERPRTAGRRHWPHPISAELFYGIFTLQIVVGAAVALAPGSLIALVVNAQALNGIITPMLLT